MASIFGVDDIDVLQHQMMTVAPDTIVLNLARLQSCLPDCRDDEWRAADVSEMYWFLKQKCDEAEESRELWLRTQLSELQAHVDSCTSLLPLSRAADGNVDQAARSQFFKTSMFTSPACTHWMWAASELRLDILDDSPRYGSAAPWPVARKSIPQDETCRVFEGGRLSRTYESAAWLLRVEMECASIKGLQQRCKCFCEGTTADPTNA
jgi:hypothetical protein